MRKLAGLGILLLLLLACPTTSPPTPDRDKVARALAESIQEEEAELRQQGLYVHILQTMAKSLHEGSLYLKLLLLALLLTGLGFGISLAFEAWRKRGKRLSPQVAEPPLTDKQLGRGSILEQLASQHLYNQAIVALHRKTVAELEEELRLKLKGYTNYMIAERIQASLKREAFKAIAGLAERVVFAREPLGRDEFLVCQSLYLENFSKRQAE